MIVSLFSAIVIFLGFCSKTGAASVFHHAYETKMYPIHIEIANDCFDTKWSLLVSEPVARFIKNLADCLPNGEARQRLEDSNLDISLRAEERETTLQQTERIARKMKPWHLLRRWNIRPHVEIGPGAFKHDIVNLPPETLGKDMKKLVALQNRQETRAKDLNEGNENQ